LLEEQGEYREIAEAESGRKRRVKRKRAESGMAMGNEAKPKAPCHGR
jgi:hypothetical protein